jgi:hypothetical protein
MLYPSLFVTGRHSWMKNKHMFLLYQQMRVLFLKIFSVTSPSYQLRVFLSLVALHGNPKGKRSFSPMRTIGYSSRRTAASGIKKYMGGWANICVDRNSNHFHYHEEIKRGRYWYTRD